MSLLKSSNESRTQRCNYIVANPAVQPQCHVYALDKYISNLPPAAIEKDLFYCRPCSVLPDDKNKAWYLAVAVGRNVLSKMVTDMCAEACVIVA